MIPNAEKIMSGLKQLWIKIMQFAEALEGVDDLKDDYILSLGKRVDRLEHHVENLEGTQHSRL